MVFSTLTKTFMKQHIGLKILMIVQLALLAIACGYCLFTSNPTPLGLFIICVPLWFLSLVCLIFLIVYTLMKRFRSLLLATIVFNVLISLLFFVGIRLGGHRGYYEHMNRVTYDTIPYRMIPERFVADNSSAISAVFVIHKCSFRRKSIFSDEFKKMENSGPYDWNDFYSLYIEQEPPMMSAVYEKGSDIPDLRSLGMDILTVPNESVIWHGTGYERVQFDYVNGAFPDDTIKLLIKQDNKNDTIILIKR